VVQLPLALDRILSGQSPYAADYSATILGRQARVSSFWEPYGGNPILRHHAYLPGTHLLTLPFYLASRALFSFFDPRFVSLLAWLAAAVLATRVVEGSAARLSAAALVLVNPLVYWPQVFGANDLVFVALVLLALVLARASRPMAAGAVLGLACATKQLAWPFAPFLLASLSGARSFRELLSAAALARLRRPVLAAAVVFAAVVLPVAALDFRAFYGDIVAYNVGLPGGDNYPLGGTPGFGFANFLIYFGRVASLKEYVPFGAFYALLVPLGLLLLRVQLTDGRPGASLFTGSVALVASVYFSRVAHPNYLVAAATLLPLAALVGAVSGWAVLAPLLLLGLAVEIAENAVFRATWEQAVAADLPARAGALVGALRPRAGPALTSDPLGLLFSAIAAGLALAWLVAAAAGAPPRWRAALAGLAVALVVLAPAAIVIGVGSRTGIERGQDPWIVQVPADAARLLRGESPYREPTATAPRAREAWATSFRQEPARELLPDRPLVPAGAAALAAPLRVLGVFDPRVLAMAAVTWMVVLFSRACPAGRRPAALVLALLPPVAFGIVFGAPALLPLAALATLAVLDPRRHPALAGVATGVAAALDHRTLLIAPFLLAPSAADGVRWRRLLAAGALAYAVLALPAIVMDSGAWLAFVGQTRPLQPSVGLANVFLYRGGEAARGLFAAVRIAIVAMVALVLWRNRMRSALTTAAAAALALVFVADGESPEALAMPLVLLVLGVASGSASPPEEDAEIGVRTSGASTAPR
jgi:uncharacterized membrane protein